MTVAKETPHIVCPTCGSESFKAEASAVEEDGRRGWDLTCQEGHKWTHTPDRKAA